MVLEPSRLDGKRALVLGAATGSGRAIALALAEAGADLALCTVTTDGEEVFALRKTARQVRELGRAAIEQAIDASLGTGAQVMVRQVSKELGRIDVLVNAPPVASGFLDKPTTKVSDAEWSQVIGRTLGATFFACRAVGREMLKEAPDGQPGGRIINVASVLGEQGLTNAASYSAAQGGILNLTRALAQEWAAQGITVNAIAEGWLEHSPALDDSTPETVRYAPIKRAGWPDEVAPLAVYLASDASGDVTGQVLLVNRGPTVHL